jgi:hypothetical protein
LIDLITSTVACYWDPGGPGISTFSGTLVFHQSWEISDQIERILETLRRVKSHETDPTTVKKPWYGFPFDADRQPNFAERVTIDLQSVTLTELVEELNKQTSLQVRLNQRVLETRGWDASTTVRFLAQDEPLWPALRGALQRHELDVAYDYPFLMITVKEDAARQSLRVYPIHDLVNDTSVRLPDSNPSLVIRLQEASGCYADCGDLVDLVTSVIDYGSWRELGGEGVIQVSKVPLALVVSQSLENHERIEDLLRRLRQLPKIKRDSAMPCVALYRLSPEVPVEQTIALLRQLVPDARHDHREGENPTYLDSFGQGILVCHTGPCIVASSKCSGRSGCFSVPRSTPTMAWVDSAPASRPMVSSSEWRRADGLPGSKRVIAWDRFEWPVWRGQSME